MLTKLSLMKKLFSVFFLLVFLVLVTVKFSEAGIDENKAKVEVVNKSIVSSHVALQLDVNAVWPPGHGEVQYIFDSQNYTLIKKQDKLRLLRRPPTLYIGQHAYWSAHGDMCSNINPGALKQMS